MPTKKKTSAAAQPTETTDQAIAKTSTKAPSKAPTKTAKAAAKVAEGTSRKQQRQGTTRRQPRSPARRLRAPARKTKIATKDAPEVDAETEEAAARPTRARRSNDALVIVESPAKAKTIKKYLGAGYVVKASVGHVKDLPKTKMGIDIEHGFQPEYVVIDGKKKVLAEIKEAARHGRQRSAWRPTPIAKGRRSPGTSPRRSAPPTRTSSASCSTRSPRRRSPRRSASRCELDVQEVRVAAGAPRSSTAWSATRSARCCGPRCSAGCRPGACSRWRCAWSSSARRRSRAFKPEEYWTVEADGRGARARRRSRPRSAKLDGKKAELAHEGAGRARSSTIMQGAVAAWSPASSARSGARTRRRRSSPRKLQQEASQQAALLAQADDGAGAAAVRRRRARRRGPGRSHHVHAYRLDAHLRRRASPRRAPTSRERYGADVPAGRADRLQDARRARRTRTRRSARRRSSTTRRRCAQPWAGGKGGGRDERETDDLLQALHADLEPLRRLPDGAGGLRPDHDRHRAPGASSCAPPARS